MADFTPVTGSEGGQIVREQTSVVIALSYNSAQDNIVAHAGGGQAGGTPLTAMINRVTVVATIADSVTLMPALMAQPNCGLQILVVNAAANSLNIFPAPGDNINALGANAAYALAGAATKAVTFNCTGNGQWHTILSA